MKLEKLNSAVQFSRNFWNFDMHVGNKYDFVRTIIKQFLKFLFCQQNVSQKNLNPSQTVTVSWMYPPSYYN